MTQSVGSIYKAVTLCISANTQITQLFRHFSDTPWSILLDSANSQHANGQYDLFVAKPVATLTARKTQGEICQVSGSTRLVDMTNPVAVIKDFADSSLPKRDMHSEQLASALPFKAGIMGLFGYDLGRRLEVLPENAEDDYQAPDLALGAYTWSVIKDNHSGKFTLIWLDGYWAPEARDIEALAHKQYFNDQSFCLTSDWQSNLSEVQYQQKITRIHQYLRAGDCYQVNLAQRFSSEYTGDEWQAYLTLRQTNQAPFSAFIRLPKCTVLSISPERFLQVHQGEVETKPIKGTRPRSADPKQDAVEVQRLLDSAKDQAENLMIVDLLRNDLSKCCEPGSVQVPELFNIETFKAVHHLVSTVTGTLRTGCSALDLLGGAFPGGSITGAPKIRAMQIIDELEPHRRNIYCGSIGYMDLHGNMDTSICIRTLLCESGRIHCWAGGGIVLDSIAEAEYQESLDKVSQILPVLTKDHPTAPAVRDKT